MTKRALLTALILAALPAAALAYHIDGPGYAAPPVRLPVRVITVYHAVPEQTDDDPFTTADGTTWDTETIAGQRIAALSREMLDRWGGPVEYGDAILVEIPGSDLSGVWWVRDTMANKVYKGGAWEPLRGYVDLLVPAHVMGCWQRGMRVYLIGGAH